VTKEDESLHRTQEGDLSSFCVNSSAMILEANDLLSVMKVKSEDHSLLGSSI
jgi:hypothetical protein